MNNITINKKDRIYQFLPMVYDFDSRKTIINVLPIITKKYGHYLNLHELLFKISNISVDMVDNNSTNNVAASTKLNPFNFTIYINDHNLSVYSKEIAIIHELMHIITKYYNMTGIVSQKNQKYLQINEMLNHMLTHEVLKEYNPKLIDYDTSYYKKFALILKDFWIGIIPENTLYTAIFNNEIPKFEDAFENIGIPQKTLINLNTELDFGFLSFGKHAKELGVTQTDYIECLSYKWGLYLMALKRDICTDYQSKNDVDLTIAEYYYNFELIKSSMNCKFDRWLPFINVNLENEYKEITKHSLNLEFYKCMTNQELDNDFTDTADYSLAAYKEKTQELLTEYGINQNIFEIS